MLKQLFTGFFALTIAVISASVFSQSVSANAEPTVVSSPFEFCEYFNTTVVSDLLKRDCSGYSNVPGAQLVTEGLYQIANGANLVLKDMNIRYIGANYPFAFGDGKLVIDGGTYITERNCFIMLSSGPDGNNNASSLTIKSGNFIAEKATNLVNSFSPICINYANSADSATANTIFSQILAPNSYYAEYNTSSPIEISSNVQSGAESMSKDRRDITEINYINRAELSVRERIAPEPKEPTTPETPADKPVAPVLPKAPNTGRK